MLTSQYHFQFTDSKSTTSNGPFSCPPARYPREQIKFSQRQLTFNDLEHNVTKDGTMIGNFINGNPVTPIELINLEENEYGFTNPIVVLENQSDDEDDQQLSYLEDTINFDIFNCETIAKRRTSEDIQEEIVQSLYERNHARWEEIGFHPKKMTL